MFFISFCSLVSAQQVKLLSYSGRQIFNGAENKIIIASRADSSEITLKVQTGEIAEQFSTTEIYKNKRKIRYSEKVFIWKICTDKPGFQPVVVEYFRKNKLLKTDTVLFDLLEPPIFKTSLYKTSQGDSFFDFSRFKDLTPTNILGLSVHAPQGYGDYKKILITDFTISIYFKNKIAISFVNKGEMLTDESKTILAKYKKGYIKVDSIHAKLACGAEVLMKDPGPVYYPN